MLAPLTHTKTFFIIKALLNQKTRVTKVMGGQEPDPCKTELSESVVCEIISILIVISSYELRDRVSSKEISMNRGSTSEKICTSVFFSKDMSYKRICLVNSIYNCTTYS